MIANKTLTLFVCILTWPFITITASSVHVDPRSKEYIINNVLDLEGGFIELPEGCALVFGPHGKIVNGLVIGHDSRLKNVRCNSLGVLLMGSWRVKIIRDIWFDKSYLSDNQMMDNLITLQRSDYKQTLIVENDYTVELTNKRITALSLSSNTLLKLKSTISITGNNLQRYNIVSISDCHDVKIVGGELRGDVGKHQYVEGSTSEWGFALYIYQSKNIVVKKLKTSLCTGDGVYISGGEESGIGVYDNASCDITLKQCVLYDLRREGISLVHADGVLIEDCKAINMGQTEYTPPSFGIDIEPNKNKSVRNVIIRKFVTENTHADYAFATSGYQFDGINYNRENVILDKCYFDRGLAIISGGITIKNSSMKKIGLFPINVPNGAPGLVMFENCAIEEGNGIQFDGKRKLNPQLPYPTYQFKNCTITASSVYPPIAGLIWGTDLHNIKAQMVFDKCVIELKQGIKGNKLFADGINFESSFNNCIIKLNDYKVNQDKTKFLKCKIESSSNDFHVNKVNLIKCRIVSTTKNNP